MVKGDKPKRMNLVMSMQLRYVERKASQFTASDMPRILNNTRHKLRRNKHEMSNLAAVTISFPCHGDTTSKCSGLVMIWLQQQLRYLSTYVPPPESDSSYVPFCTFILSKLKIKQK